VALRLAQKLNSHLELVVETYDPSTTHAPSRRADISHVTKVKLVTSHTSTTTRTALVEDSVLDCRSFRKSTARF
jgi:hypothetical protein